jgi:hypothetical protein
MKEGAVPRRACLPRRYFHRVLAADIEEAGASSALAPRQMGATGIKRRRMIDTREGLKKWFGGFGVKSRTPDISYRDFPILRSCRRT